MRRVRREREAVIVDVVRVPPWMHTRCMLYHDVCECRRAVCARLVDRYCYYDYYDYYYCYYYYYYYSYYSYYSYSYYYYYH